MARLIRIKIVLFIFYFVFVFATIAQADEEFLEGYVVLNSGDTLRGFVKDRNLDSFPSLLTKIKFKDERGRRKKFKVSKLQAYGRGSQTFERVWLNVTTERLVTRYRSIPGQGGQQFLRVLHKGALEHYELEWTDQEDNQILSFPLLKKQGSNELVRATQGVLGLKRKRLREYFGDCRPLLRSINSREVTDIEGIIEVYESHCSD